MPELENTFDLFEREQEIFDRAVKYSNEVRNMQICEPENFHNLVKEYGILLKQLQRVIKLYDKNTENLNSTKIDLLDKVRYDALTGIYNRGYLEEKLTYFINKLPESGEALTVMMMDIDYFKQFNDTYGHNAGDCCLQKIAKGIAESLTRKEDFVARYGGEEFCIVLPSTDEDTAQVIASRILERIRMLHIEHAKNDAAPYVTMSIGVTTVKNIVSCTKEDLLKMADKALYQSKNGGRNQYTYLKYNQTLS